MKKKKMMKTARKRSSGKRFGVFDFNEADKRVEKVSKTILSKYGKPNSTHNISPLTKYDFLRCFAQGTKSKRKDSINKILDVDASDAAVKEAISGLDVTAPSGSSDYKSDTCPNYSYAARTLNHGATRAGTKHLENEPITINSDGDDDVELNSSTSTSDIAENEGPLKEKELENCFGGCVADTTIVVSPDYIIYRDMYCSKSLLTFSSHCIKVECSAGCGIRGPCSFEWTVGDIINIESQWCLKVETAVLNLHLRSKDTGVAENTNSGPGIAELQFAVFDPNWSKVQESIKLLNGTYKAKWNLVSNTDTARSQYACLGNNNIFFSKHNFSNLDESFEEVIYPKGDPDAVSLSKRDIELLQPETFINDTIIDFYIKYLNNKIKPEEKHRFHFFNSFFFRKLADLDKDPCNACEGRAAFQRVRKWTRKVDLFEKDYIFIPVNFSLHWSLIVICHPGDVANIGDEDVEKLPKIPCILHMDSIKGSHRGLKNLIQSYLWEEWKERKNQLLGEVSSKFLNLRFVSLELPQQENSFDCGIFLLHYVELFLDQAPVGFSPFKLTKFSSFLSKDWFPPAEASLKRAHIKQLIHEIVEDSSQKAPPAPCNDHKNPFCVSPSIDERDNGAKLLLKICNSPEICHCNCSSCIGDQEIEITLSAASSLRGVHCSKEQDLIFSGIEPRATGGLLLDGSYQTSRQLVSLDRFKNVMSPIEEVEEILEQQFASSSTEKASGQQQDEVTEPPMPASVASSFPADSIHIEESEDGDTFSGTSIGGSPVSSEVGMKEVYHPAEFLSSNPEGDRDKSESPLSTSDGFVEDSEEEDVHATEKSPFHLGKILGSSCQEVNLTENVQANDILIVLDLEEQPAAKRPSERRIRRSLWKDVR